jgi:tRNA 2-thiouridine synthesizing protein A
MDDTGQLMTLDTCGLHCPIPILRTKQALARMNAGERLLVKSTDSDSVGDFYAFTAAQGHRIVNHETRENIYLFVIEKRA